MSPNEPTKERPLSYVLLESPFVSVSTVSIAHPSVVSFVRQSQEIFGCPEGEYDERGS
jgi:hypothetical protein